MKDWVRKQLSSPQHTIREVIRTISNAQIGVSVIVNEQDKLLGYVTDSDIRRAILNNVSLDTPVSEIMVKKPFTVPVGLSSEEVLVLMKKNRVNRAPVVDLDGVVQDIVISWRLQEEVKPQPAAPALDFSIPSKRDSKKGKKVLVIGAGGYVGSVVCRELLQEGYEVRGLDRFLFGDESLQEIIHHEHFELVRGDIRNLDVLVDATFGVDAVINLAAIVGDPACDLDVNHTIMINYFSAKAAADAARHYKVDRYLFASTAAVYGASSGKDRLTETAAVAPVSLYAESKLHSEKGILSLATDDFSPCIFRLGTVFGLSPRMRFDLVVNLFAMQAYFNKKITVFGGTQYRPYVHVRDIARALIAALKAEKSKIHGQIFNLGANKMNLRLVDLADQVAAAMPGTQVIRQEQASDQRDYNVSFDKIRERLGFESDWDIPAAIREIREAFERGEFKDFQDKKYSNVKQQEHLIFG